MANIRREKIEILEKINKGLISADEGKKLLEKLYEKKTAGYGAAAEICCFLPTWENEEITDKIDNIKEFERILIFDAGGGTYELVVKEQSDSGMKPGRIAVVKSGESFKRLEGDCFEINPRDVEDYKRLFSNLVEIDMFPDLILYLWPFSMGETNSKNAEEEGLFHFYNLFYITFQCMNTMPKAGVKLIYAYPFGNGQAAPFHIAFGGFIKSVYRENPAFRYKSVGISPRDLKPGGQDRVTVRTLLREAYSENGAFEVRYVGQTRQSRRFLYRDRLESTPGILKKDGGVYLITGGMGGLGLLFAKHLTEKKNARIVLVGRSEPDGEKREKLEALKAAGYKVEYIKGDICSAEDVHRLLEQVRLKFGKLNGIIHCAGVMRDSLVVKKDFSDARSVLLPKTVGTVILDEASKDDELDFFIMFSSIASVTGNPGQCDYAFGNAFMDGYAEFREQLRQQGLRKGKTLSVNWPLWEEGGMKVEDARRKFLSSMGIEALPSDIGLKIADELLNTGFPQVSVVYGDRSRVKRLIEDSYRGESENKISVLHSPDETTLCHTAEAILKEIFSSIIKMPEFKIDVDMSFQDYGLDSVMVTRFNGEVEKRFGTLPKTLLYEYNTIRGLAGYLAENHPAILCSRLNREEKEKEDAGIRNVSSRESIKSPSGIVLSKAGGSDAAIAGHNRKYDEDIAIIGVNGRYPFARDISDFWNNLKSGRDCVTEIPLSRWDYREYYDPNPENAKYGKMYSRWGAFIEGEDKFDALFFNISPREAELMDPQERLFLQVAWAAMEDAGYTRNRNKEYVRNDKRAKIGVFVGVTTNTYLLWGPEEWRKGNMVIPNSLEWSVANRVSYVFNFNGPSIPVDTACSSSLTAVHLACESIRKGECSMAIAGGVNLYLHPSKYISMCQLKMLSPTGRCHSFGAGGDGFVPGEGVGAVVLKPLRDAITDRDNIYAVIKGSAVNHGGKTSGYTVPSPNAQASLILDALEVSGINPRTISYIEAHGTGTALGDPIEISGLTKAFNEYTKDRQFCAVGSVKSNVGHLESAAGIAGLTKVILQMKYKKLVPSLHCQELNPNIDFAVTPFYVQRSYKDWIRPKISVGGEEREVPRRAGISSFGAGGANAHIILEEYNPLETAKYLESKPRLFLLSAKNSDRLNQYASELADFLENMVQNMKDGEYDASCLEEYNSAGNIAYTLAVGREAMEERLALVASTVPELILRLKEFLSGKQEGKNWVCNNIRKTGNNASLFDQDEDFKEIIEKWFEEGKLFKLAEMWTRGIEPEFEKLYASENCCRVSLPTYPFAGERYWIPTKEGPLADPTGGEKGKKAADVESREYKQPSVSYYVKEWEDTGLVNIDESFIPKGIILVFDTGEDIFRQLQKKLSTVENVETRAILVKAGEIFDRTENCIYTVRPQNLEDYRRIVEKEELASWGNVSVLYFWPGSNLSEDEEPLPEENSADTAISLFCLCRTLMERKLKGKVNILHAYRLNRGDIRPVSEALTGFMKSVMLENPGYTMRNLGIVEDGQKTVTASTFLKLCLHELNIAESPVDVRVDGMKRMTGVMKEATPTIEGSGIEIRNSGVYLITGGTGGLGLIFAEHFAQKSGIKLVLSGRSQLDKKIREKLSTLQEKGAEIFYIPVDVCSKNDVMKLVNEIKSRFGRIHGVIHAAGVNRDAFLMKKTGDDFKAVLAPKVRGTINMDRALEGEDLDFFILFSSVSAVLGNFGQCDYAYANAFMDSFAAKREKKRRENMRKGKTLSINWSLWQDGGMMISEENKAAMYRKTGILPMPVRQGLSAWECCMFVKDTSIAVFYGDKDKLRQAMNSTGIRENRESRLKNGEYSEPDRSLIVEKAREFLQEAFEEILKLPRDKMSPDTRFEEYGIDSVTVEQFNSKMESVFGELSKTLLYEYQTLEELTAYLADNHPGKIAEMYRLNVCETNVQNDGDDDRLALRLGESHDTPESGQVPVVLPAAKVERKDDIAVIGLAGRYPGAGTLDELWENMKNGVHCVGEVPLGRWDWKKYYHPDPDMAQEGKIYCKWGAFIEDADKFDPLFFNISPKEARIMDPQERLFLEIAWETFEDAGYTRKTLMELTGGNKAANVGVFVGVTTNTYQLYGPQEWIKGNMVMPNSLEWSIANRVSYVFNLRGPSMPVDTACSSSLTAIHLACESLKKGECEMALAGGANLYLHPAKYLYLCQLRMLSPTGKCHTFGSDGDGFVPGEGVGAVLLKPLEAALRDRDHIYAVIKGSSVNHGGNTSGYTVPNPVAQAELILNALKRSGVHPRSISYIEAHGTGTALGDPIEIKGLTQAFSEYTNEKQFCSIGSIKSNIGHLEAAAGIAGLTKVLLQMRHKKLVPSLIHSKGLNPNIDFENTPFYVQQSFEYWNESKDSKGGETCFPRRAGISSFGAGGANAHVIIEEYIREEMSAESDEKGKYLFVLSARSEKQLKEYAEKFYQFLDRKAEEYSLKDVCYTLQVGREAMEERLAVVADGIDDLKSKLTDYINGERETGRFIRGRAIEKTRQISGNNGIDLEELAKVWVEGANFNFETLYSGRLPCRVALPTYPFEKERCWIPISEKPVAGKLDGKSALHPMLDANESTFEEQIYVKVFSEEDFYVRDHGVEGKKVLPGVAYIEMALAAYRLASGGKQVRRIMDVLWQRPLVLQKPEKVFVRLYPEEYGAEFEIYTLQENLEKNIYSSGMIEYLNQEAGLRLQPINLDKIKERCRECVDGDRYYMHFEEAGLHYGDSFRAVDRIWVGKEEALAALMLPPTVKQGYEEYVLHPSIADGTLQAVMILMAGEGFDKNMVYLPYNIGEIEVFGPIHSDCYAYVSQSNKAGGKTLNQAGFNVTVTDGEGNVRVRIKDYITRAVAKQKEKPIDVPSILKMLERGEIELEEAEKLLEL